MRRRQSAHQYGHSTRARSLDASGDITRHLSGPRVCSGMQRRARRDSCGPDGPSADPRHIPGKGKGLIKLVFFFIECTMQAPTRIESLVEITRTWERLRAHTSRRPQPTRELEVGLACLPDAALARRAARVLAHRAPPVARASRGSPRAAPRAPATQRIVLKTSAYVLGSFHQPHQHRL